MLTLLEDELKANVRAKAQIAHETIGQFITKADQCKGMSGRRLMLLVTCYTGCMQYASNSYEEDPTDLQRSKNLPNRTRQKANGQDKK